MSLPGPANSGACLSVPLSQDPYSRGTEVLPLFGSEIGRSISVERQVSARLEKAGKVYQTWKKKVFCSRALVLSLKYASSEPWCCLCSSMDGAETWTVTQHDSHKLKSFQMYCLSDILGITLWNEVWNTVITGENKDGASGGTA